MNRNAIPIAPLSPTQPDQWIRLGEAQLAIDEYDLAMLSFNEAIAIDPSLPKAWLGQAKALHKKRWYAEAIVYYEQALLLDDRCQEAFRCQHAAIRALDYEAIRDAEAVDAEPLIIQVEEA